MQLGWSRRDADHLGLIEYALDVAPGLRDVDSLRRVAEHAGTALAWDPVFHGAQSLYAGEGHAPIWRLLADFVDDPARSRMLVLAALGESRDVVTVPPEEIGSLMGEDDLHLLAAARAAEVAGDFAGAIDYLRDAVRPLDDGWMRDLEQLVDRGDELHPSRWGRWICSAAVRNLLAHPVGLDAALHLSTVALTALGATPAQIRTETLPRAHYDQIVHDALLFDERGLATFLELVLSREVAARVAGLDDWPAAAPTVVRLEEELPGGDSRCRDLVTGREVVIGEQRMAGPGSSARDFYGRLVRIHGDDRWFFAMQPTVCDDLVSARLVAAIRDQASPEHRIREVHRGMAASASS